MKRSMRVKLEMHTFLLKWMLLVLSSHLTSLAYNSGRRTWERLVLLSLQVFNRKLRKKVAFSRLMEVMTQDFTITLRVL
jgi:hypothetical protein